MSREISFLRKALRVAAVAVFAAFALHSAPVFAAPLTIVAFGDSLVAGLGLPEEQAFPARLEAALRDRGHDVTILNAGVSGDTTAAGLARLDWSIPDGVDGVIVELGANDMLRGVDPAQTRSNVDAILARLKERNIPVLLAGMRASPNLGPEYGARFDAIFPELAKKHDASLYPFFLEGVAARSSLNQPDGMHPNPQGVDTIVANFVPVMEAFLQRAASTAMVK
jgi:acyl-CoA thioesterase-1